jgi:hypothetical protein
MENEKYFEIFKETKDGNEQFKEYLIKNNKLYIRRKDKILRIIPRYELEEIMRLYHDHETAAHFGKETTYDKVKNKYYWPTMKTDVEIYVKTCDQCQRRGKRTTKNELHSIKISRPFQRVGIDIVGPLPLTDKRNKYIITAMDYLTKWPEARAIKMANAEEVLDFIYEDIICRHGCPQKILTDRGSHFNNQIITKMMEKFKIVHNFSTPYHPKTNGLIERFNKTICEAIAKSGETKNWDEKIAPTLLAYRTTKHSSTKIEPFKLMYGREPKLFEELNEENNNEENFENIEVIDERINEIDKDLPRLMEEAKKNIIKAQEKQKFQHDKKIKPRHFQIGEKVLRYDAAKEKQWTGKLEEKWKGPYYIHEILLNGSYKLKEIDGQVIKVPVNGELLKKYYSREGFIPYVIV